MVHAHFTGGKSRGSGVCCAGGSAPVDDDSDDRKATEMKTKQKRVSSVDHCSSTSSSAVTEQKQQSTQEELVNDDNAEDGIQLPWLNRFMGNTYAKFLVKTPAKTTIMLVYAGLLAGAIYGIANLKEGIDQANIAPDDSYFRDFYRKYTRDFTQIYGPVIHVSIDDTLDYTDPKVRSEYSDLIQKFQDNKYFVSSDDFVISWLDRFVDYLRSQSIDVNSLSMSEFIAKLQNDFFTDESYRYHLADVVISADNTSITASRFFVQTRGLTDAVEERDMMLAARRIADDYKWKVQVFAPPFIFFDQYVVILANTLQNLGIAVGAIAVVSLVLIPSVTAVVWVTLATVSICSMVIGYMSLWDVSLDSVSMINLIICIGFAVDFAAHISYHFVASASADSNENARDALGALGTPILQGAASTLIAVAALSTSSTYIFRTFFKVMSLVMVLGLFHAIAVLPVLLSTLNRKACTKTSKGFNIAVKKSTKTSKSAVQRAPENAFDNPAVVL